MADPRRDTSGPAFPRPVLTVPAVPSVPDVVDVDKPQGEGPEPAIEEEQLGITIRDYFATRAMQALITGALAVNQPINPRGIAKQARLLSEAMRLELGK